MTSWCRWASLRTMRAPVVAHTEFWRTPMLTTTYSHSTAFMKRRARRFDRRTEGKATNERE
jgi:hypothetical protein